MICECGQDLRHVTLKTKGLCSCKRSIWMQVAKRFVPKSEAIARSLNKRQASTCVHQNSPCISRCGVRLGLKGWEVISESRRQDWFDSVMRPAAKSSLWTQPSILKGPR